jgi:hypothetical protein
MLEEFARSGEDGFGYHLFHSPRQALCLMDNQHLPSSNHFGRSFSLKISKHSSLHLYDAFIVT